MDCSCQFIEGGTEFSLPKQHGTNIAAAIFFWPAMLGTFKNTEDAIEAAKDKKRHLEKIAASKKCRIV
jgi:hypothetical protein